MSVAIMRKDLSATEAPRVTARLKDEKAARAGGMDRQTLRDWVHRYNGEGVAGLSNRRPAGAGSPA